MNTNKKLNMTMLCDFYELTMGNGYFKAGYKDRITHFDLFFRSVPDNGGYAIAAGLEQVIEYIQDLHFDPEDIAYLRGRKIFDEDFLDYLRELSVHRGHLGRPRGDAGLPQRAHSDRAGPGHPGPAAGDLHLLLTINHQSLIATKANRIVRAARGRAVLEFGSRRAQGSERRHRRAPGPPSSAAARGRPAPSPTSSTACPPGAPWPTPGCRCLTPSTRPSGPTARSIPTNAVLLVDTYNTLKIRRARCHPGLQRRAQAQGHHQMRHPPGLRATWPTSPRRPARCWTRPDGPSAHITVSNSLDEYHHPGPPPPGSADRHLRRGRASDHRPERTRLWRGVQAGGRMRTTRAT